MKTIKKLLLVLVVFVFLFTTKTYGQEEPKEENKPVYLTVTTMHRSSDTTVDFSDWLKTETEYYEKVTSKNDLIIGSGFYFHYFTPDDTEVLLVSVYKNWDDIEKANDVTNKLIEEGWPDKDERDKFFKKQSSYYEDMHSDEIYRSLPFSKFHEPSDKPLIFYVKKNQLGNGGGAGFKEYFENITNKNSLIKGYYTHRHLWGANSKDAIEVFVFDNFADIENSFKENNKLIETYWADKDKRKEFFDKYSKIFSGHGDYIYQNVPELHK